MRSLTSALALVLAMGFGFCAQAATPLEIWPQQFSSLDKNALKAQGDLVDTAAATLPGELVPAVRFQKIFLQILSGAPPSAWRGEIEKFAGSTGQGPVESGLAGISRAWLARLEMADIDTALHNYYRRNVRFPGTLAEIEADLPENLRKDPWGDPWIYKTAAPQGFEGFDGQRYQLGPTRFPQLGSLGDAILHRANQIPSWTITPHDISGSKALEFRSERAGNPVITTIQAGGRVDDCILLYIGDKWALMAGTDQLFAITFYMAGITDFLTSEAMRKLETLVVRSRYVVEGFRAGMHASPLKGASVEFADHRQYVKGDNLRNLDWKVFGRTERYYVKRFEEETSLRTHVVIDGSGSMAYSSGDRPSKYTYACRVAAALGYIVSRQQDSLGLTIFDDEIREQIPARGDSRHLRLFVERLSAHEPKNRTNTGAALHKLAETVSRRGLIVLMSDLFDDPEAVFRAIAHFRKKMHDVILLQILDPCELELSIDRVAEFIDMETGEKLELDPALARLAYKQELQKSIDDCRQKCAVMNVDYRLVSTEGSFEDFIAQYLAERRRMSL